MKLIKKDIPKEDSLFVGGESQEYYDKRRLSVEEDSYVLQGLDEDITSIENWKLVCCDLTTDYVQTRQRIIELFRWSNATSIEKDIAIEYFAYDPTESLATNDTNKVIHLIGKGMSSIEAELFLKDSYVSYHTKEKESYKKRNDSEKLSSVVLTYLNMQDASLFIKTVKNLRNLYWQSAIVGTQYGLVGEGIMDYINSVVGTDYENAGLEQEGFSLNVGTWDDFKNDLEDVLVNGVY
jgi:hypothetical protein